LSRERRLTIDGVACDVADAGEAKADDWPPLDDVDDERPHLVGLRLWKNELAAERLLAPP